MKNQFFLPFSLLAAALLLAPLQSDAGEITSKGEALLKELDSLHVESHWLAHAHVNWMTGIADRPTDPTKLNSHCSAFTAAACMHLGVFILRPPQHSQILLANAQYDWLKTEGPAEGWRQEEDPVKVQELANEGTIVVAVYKSPDPNKSGHIAVVRPSTKSVELIQKEGPEITQAGKDNYRATSVEVGFQNHPGAWQQHQILFFSHAWNPGSGAAAPSDFPTPVPSPAVIPSAGMNGSPGKASASPDQTSVQKPAPAPSMAEVSKIPPASSGVIRVALYADKGSEHGGDWVQKCLEKDKDPGKYYCFQVSGSMIREGVLAYADVLVQGGGSGHICAAALEPAGLEQIREFVKNGGGYLGFCAGSYLASSYYPWSLHIINSIVADRDHWARGKGMLKLGVTPAGKALLGIEKDVIDCQYHDGPLMAPAAEPGLPAYEELATFQTEVNESNAPPGIMIGKTAIADAVYGKGKVICSSPHPEATKGLDGLVRRAVQWVAPARFSNSTANASAVTATVVR